MDNDSINAAKRHIKQNNTFDRKLSSLSSLPIFSLDPLEFN